MKSLVSLALGAIVSFVATVLAIGAGVLLATGVGGGILVRERPSAGRVLNYDPSTVVARAIVTGCAALVFVVLYAMIYRRLRRAERSRMVRR